MQPRAERWLQWAPREERWLQPLAYLEKIFFLGAVELGWPVLAALRGGGITVGIVWLEELAAALEELAAAPRYFGRGIFGSIVR